VVAILLTSTVSIVNTLNHAAIKVHRISWKYDPLVHSAR